MRLRSGKVIDVKKEKKKVKRVIQTSLVSDFGFPDHKFKKRPHIIVKYVQTTIKRLCNCVHRTQ